MNELQRMKMESLLRSNLIASTGCTEPIAIAYAAALARKHLNETPVSLIVRLSSNMAKNAMDAGIPGTKYTGAAFVAALGTLYANPDRGFQLLEELSAEQKEAANIFAQNCVTVELAPTDKQLYIEIILNGSSFEVACQRCCNTARVVVADGHQSVHTIEVNGEIVFFATVTQGDEVKTDSELDKTNFSMKEAFEYVETAEDFSLFKNAASLNSKLSEVGKENLWGLNVGKVYPFGEDTIFARIISATTAAVDARMGGAPYAAMACTGSGNQGITTTMPVLQVAKELGASEVTTLKAIAISDLAAIYVKKNLNVLSHLCGAVIAGSGAAAGIVYLMGGDYQIAECAMQSVLTSLTGMFCDGAKSTCALKVLSVISTSVYAAAMAFDENSKLNSKVGITCADIARTIDNIALIERNSSTVMDRTILEIIVK